MTNDIVSDSPSPVPASNSYIHALGLDLGVSSLGWALLRLDAKTQEPLGVVAIGARVFPAGVDGDIETGRDESRGVKRRERRLQRRQLWRRARRDASVYRRLMEAGLLPKVERADPVLRHDALLALDAELAAQLRAKGVSEVLLGDRLVHAVRKRALDQALPAYHVGRALYHLAQRRGFLSNRIADVSDDEAGEDLGKVKGGIRTLEESMHDESARTLGEFLAARSSSEGVRRRYTSRQMVQSEFAAIWAAQSVHHPAVMTPAARDKIWRAAFAQRPLKSQRHLVARCELEPRARRAMIADPLFQEFRILQRVNDIKVELNEFESRPLTPDERTTAVNALMSQGELAFTALRKLLGVPRTSKFNLERGGEKRLVGNRTRARLVTALGDALGTLADHDRDRLIQLLLFCDKEATIRRIGVDFLKLDTARADHLAMTTLEPGTAALSRKALRRLLPPMRDGVPFATARHALYPKPPTTPIDALPPVTSTLRTLRNPAVIRALTELRHVVNAVVRKFGKPELARIELARDMKRPRSVRKEMSKTMRAREAERSHARTSIERELGFTDVKRSDIEKYLLWKECSAECPYTGRQIGLRDLFSKTPTIDVEHIIPYSISLDDSFANKTLCDAAENRRVKRNRTPFAAYAGDEAKWTAILARVDRFKGDTRRKKQAFRIESIPAEFSDRQLNDTRYASALAQDFVGLLFGGAVDASSRRRVQASSGGVTAQVRRTFGLSQLLGGDGEKTRDDHRHHAVDAVAIAATTPWIVERLQRAAERADARPGRTPKVPDISDALRAEVSAALAGIVVSHRRPGNDGPLHDESLYGQLPNGTTVIRKAIADLSRDSLESIVDPVVRERVRAACGDLEPKVAFANDQWPTMPSGTPIKRVRIEKSDKVVAVGSGHRGRLVKPNGNSHLEVFVHDSGQKVQWRIVTRLEAYRRRSVGGSVVDTTPPAVGWRYLTQLRVGDALSRTAGTQPGAEQEIMILENISRDQIEFKLHTDARPAAVRRKIAGSRIVLSPAAFVRQSLRRLGSDALGNVRPSRA